MFSSYKSLASSTVIVQDPNLLFQAGGQADDLQAEADFSVAYCAEPLPAFLAYCGSVAPCVGIIRAESPQSLKEQKLSETLRGQKGVRLLLSGGCCNDEEISELLSMGCWGVLPSGAPPEEVKQAVLAVSRDEIWASRHLLTRLFRRFALSETQKLSRRELDIIKLLANDSTNKEVAESLFISPETLRWHLRNLYAKTGIHDRRSLIAYAKELSRENTESPNVASASLFV